MVMPPVDTAILDVVGFSTEDAIFTNYGGSDFSATFHLSGLKNGRRVTYFAKEGKGSEAATMFRGEHASLNAIHAVVPDLCPASRGHGELGNGLDYYFIVTDLIDLQATDPPGSGRSLAQKLAALHKAPVPIPEGYDRPMFGFPVPTCCGATEQNNSWKPTWAEFYADNRIRAIGRACLNANSGEDTGADPELREAIEVTASKIVPRLLGEDTMGPLTPSLVHGDLWNGNKGRGIVGGQGGVEEVIFDPSCVYGHSEYELGIMRMFGGFGSAFWKEYERLIPKAEPKAEWEDRMALYELYHNLNHYALFGGEYRYAALGIMRKLIKKYG
ncbi:Ketosamine-3-kinase [Cryphonectria parasitica EP155]|uniref:protein-ribulosamine 3-kinase n=1 Tax=Cryphonectria parasitica (strain ATCC 38755 / EP155) TaxID=660469 RepID=A0A9P5CQC2_CRYP1|nr:Ketosamine-3-kinase [Cryphonectria parasitica EP155]KAF3766292.1 Ketosamine-3-kinase [Cryphonectria parasitica EP155]